MLYLSCNADGLHFCGCFTSATVLSPCLFAFLTIALKQVPLQLRIPIAPSPLSRFGVHAHAPPDTTVVFFLCRVLFCPFYTFSCVEWCDCQNQLYKLEFSFLFCVIVFVFVKTNRFWPVISIEALACDPTAIFSAVPSYYTAKNGSFV